MIVSTPQDLALIDARRGVAMFQKVNVPILGIVENMSTFVCPHCGGESHIFGHGGAQDEAARIGVPFLGEVPLHMDIRERADSGRPVVVTQPDSAHSAAYRRIAKTVWSALESGSARKPAPRIVIDDEARGFARQRLPCPAAWQDRGRRHVSRDAVSA